MSRPARWAVLTVTALLLAALAFWAGRVTLAPPPATEQSPSADATVTVTERELGRVITLGVTVSRDQAPAAVNALSGVVTQAAASGEFAVGDVLYAVAQRPVILAQGELPMWRPLGEGAAGDDVALFQRALTAGGSDVEPSGTWDEATAEAWTAWLSARGFPSADTVELGQLVVVESAPTTLSIDADVAAVGSLLSGGETVVARPAATPSFVIETTQEQAALIPPGTRVTVPHDGARWEAVAEESRQDEQGRIRIGLTAPDGAAVCGDECDTLPAGPTTSLLSEVSVVPPVSGPVVPVSALRTRPDGDVVVQVVQDGDETERTVTIRGVADGLAVVDGLAPGDTVRVLNGAP